MTGLVSVSKGSFITEEEWSHIQEPDRRAIAKAIANDRIVDEVTSSISLGTAYARFGKRVLDLAIGVPAFIACLPINALLAIATYIDVGSPIFFVQERIGKNGQTFKLTKFRNMTNETNADGVLLQPEERVTKWGKFVRKTSLDELMNLWSVVKGDMSIVGPRPLPTKYAQRFSKQHAIRFMVRPGLECPFHDKVLAQTGWQGRFDNDTWYVENLTLSTDIRMFFLLIKKVFSKRERAMSASGRTGEFMGYHEDGSVMDEWSIPRKYLSILADGSLEERDGDSA